MEKDEEKRLKLNNQSREVLYSKRRVVMRRGIKNRKDITGEELFEALQKLRYEISAREYVAASALFSDSTLRDLCRILPKTRKQLASVDGMGLFKAKKYGDQILQVISLYYPDTGKKRTY